MSEQQIQPEAQEASKKKLEAKRKKEYEANRKALEELCTLYPEVFNTSSPKPLQIGVHEAIAADGKLSKTRIRRALNLYVRMRRYIACLKEDAERITLGGEVTGKVNADEAKHATEKLAEIDKKRSQKKPTQSKHKPQKNSAKSQPSKSKTAPKRTAKPKPENKVTETKADADNRLQAKLEALVNKRTN